MGFPYTFPFPLVWEQTQSVDLDALLRGEAQAFVGLDVILGAIPEKARRFILEIHDRSGNLLDVLENAIDINYSAEFAVQTLDFQLPAGDDKKLNLAWNTEIWLRDYRTDTVISKFRPASLGDRR